MSDFELPNTKPSPRPVKPTAPASALKPKPTAENSVEKGSVKARESQYSEEELLRVFDEIIFSGEYREDYYIRGKILITFKTRTAEDIGAIQKFIDAAGYNLLASVETTRSLMNLQYSLAQYDKKDFGIMKPEERMRHIENLPGPIIGVLLNMMGRFDQKVAEACKEGEENF